MRHQNKGFKLGRTSSHRKATLAALSNALIRHKRIQTTLTRARALRMYIEPIITRAKADSTHNRRMVFRDLQDKHSVTELFGEIAGKVAERPGGYVRIVKLGQRAGDSAEMAVIELVDYNDASTDEAASGRKRKTRRGAPGRGKAAKAVATGTAGAKVAAEAEEAVAEADAAAEAEDAVVETAEDVAETAAEAEEAVAEAKEAVADAAEEEAPKPPAPDTEEDEEKKD
jgi:large subunit ribosomal protein L17